jgi:hypothetical protein
MFGDQLRAGILVTGGATLDQRCFASAYLGGDRDTPTERML